MLSNQQTSICKVYLSVASHTLVWARPSLRYTASGVALMQKNCVFYAKKEQAAQIWKYRAFTVREKQWPHTSKCVQSFRFLHPPEKVCRALAMGLNILDFHRPLPPPFPFPSRWRDAGAYVLLMTWSERPVRSLQASAIVTGTNFR